MKWIVQRGWILGLLALSCQHTPLPHGEAGLLVHPAMEQLLVETGLSYDGTISDLVRVTQANWIRKGEDPFTSKKTQKRYDKAKLLPLFSQLGLVEARPWVDATGKKVTGVTLDDCLLAGGFVFTMADRLQYLHDTLDAQKLSCKRLVVLTGDRDFDPGHESVESFERLRAQFPWFQFTDAQLHAALPSLKNEYNLAQFLLVRYQAVYPTRFPSVVYVNSPKKKKGTGEWTRPTTSDTLRDYLALHPAGEVLLATSQPFGDYMHILAQRILAKSPAPLTVHTIASQTYYQELIPMGVYLDYRARALYALTQSEEKL